jgi:2-isopropylmalate synthase
MYPPRNKAIVGENAFAHEAGIHQHGMLQHSSTYEIMKPEEVGLNHTNLVLGKHSGRHAFKDRVKELGFELDEFETNRAFKEFKKFADKKKDIYDGDIESIIMNVSGSISGPWSLKSLDVQTETDKPASVKLTLIGEDGKIISESACADGPVAAVFKALENATGVNMILRNFELHSTSIGEDALGEVTVTVEINDQTYRGRGTSVDIVEAGCRAGLEVMNRTLRRRARGDANANKSQSAHANI